MDVQSRLYLQRGRARPASYVRELLDFMPPHPGCLLDMGCGAGAFALELAERAHFVVGLDPGAALLALARTRQKELGRTNVAWVLARAEEPPFRAASFDFVVSVNVLRLTDMPRVLARLRQLVKPGGRLAIKDHLQVAEPFGFWPSYLRRLLRSSPAWVQEYGWHSLVEMVRYRLTHEGIAQNKQSESLTAKVLVRVCESTLPNCRVETSKFSGVVLWERTDTAQADVPRNGTPPSSLGGEGGGGEKMVD